jgi:hypothetical protein
VLASWLVEKLEAPGPPPASFYLPLLAASRWRAPESLAAFKRWADVVGPGTTAAPGAAAAIPLIDAIINAQVGLTLSLNVLVLPTYPCGTNAGVL